MWERSSTRNYDILPWTVAVLTLPSFYREFSAGGARSGAVLGVFLASFMPNGARYGHPGVDVASGALADIVVRNAPSDSIVGYLSRLAYAVFIADGLRADGDAMARVVVEEARGSHVEFHPGETENIAAAVGVVEHDVTNDHWQTLERLSSVIAADLRKRFPDDWQYPILVYPQ